MIIRIGTGKEKCFAWDCGESNIPWAWPSSKVTKTSYFSFKELRMCQSRGKKMGLEIDDGFGHPLLFMTYQDLGLNTCILFMGNVFI